MTLKQEALLVVGADMEFVQNFTPPDFQAKNFTLSILPNFNSFSVKKTKNELEWRNLHRRQKIYTATAVTAMTNLTSGTMEL